VGTQGTVNLKRYLERHSISFTDDGETDDGRHKYILECCPFDPTHTGKDACLLQDKDGKIGFHCFHDSCSSYGWQAVKAEIGPLLGEDFDVPEGFSVASVTGEPYKKGASRYDPEEMNGKEFGEGDTEVNFLVEGVLAEQDHLIIGGRQKTLKTSITLDLMTSMAYGVPFLGEFNVAEPMPVMFVSGESGEKVLRRNWRIMCAAKNVEWDGPLHENFNISFKLPGLTVQEHIYDIVTKIEEKNLRLIVIDPIYLSFLKGSTQQISMGNLFEVGMVLEAYGDIARQTGCIMGLIHHHKKGSARNEFDIPDMGDLAQSGFAEWGRQFILLSRREIYHNDGYHPLHLTLGGSAGHGSYWHLNIDEGLDRDQIAGRKWGVEILTPEDLEESQGDGNDDLYPRIDRVRQVIARVDRASKSRLISETRLKEGQVMEALHILEDRGDVQAVKRGHLRLYEFTENVPVLG
jgi:hypothetical protein